MVQRAHRPACRRPGCPQPGQLRPGAGSGRAQAEQRGWSREPLRTGRVWPQPAHLAQRFVQARHRGLPVTLETWHGACFWQMWQVRTCRGRQVSHSGPSAARVLIRRRRPQVTQASWLAGSVTRQFEHSGRLCSSRVAASRTAPHREQGWARDLATQLRHSHCPSIRWPSRITRPHRGHAGRVMAWAPALHNWSISR